MAVIFGSICQTRLTKSQSGFWSSRGAAATQYLVNAILTYSGEQPTLQGGGNPDRRQIEQIVRVVLAGQNPPPERQRSQPAPASTPRYGRNRGCNV